MMDEERTVSIMRPDCMMPDGAEPCRGYQLLQEERDRLHEELIKATRWASDAEARSADHLAQAQHAINRINALAYELERADALYREVTGRLADVIANLPPEPLTTQNGKTFKYVGPGSLVSAEAEDLAYRVRKAAKGESALRKFVEWPHKEKTNGT